MNWPSLLENVSMFSVASGLLAWLAKELVTHSLSRDLEAFKAELEKAHAIQIEDAKNRFTVGAMSHMATVAFDKHVQFCEEYSTAVHGALLTLLRRGPHEDVLEDARKLGEIRERWSMWLVPEAEGQLDKFEGALRTIGANAYLLRELRADEDRTEAIKQAYGTFAAVMGWEKWKGEIVTRDLAADRVFDGLRKVLGIGELTQLRTELMKRAMAG
jgi:hypothetical protein